MSITFNSLYERGMLPCPLKEDMACLNAGTCQLNVDGKVIGHKDPHTGNPKHPSKIGFHTDNVPHSTHPAGHATTNNRSGIHMQRMNHL